MLLRSQIAGWKRKVEFRDHEIERLKTSVQPQKAKAVPMTTDPMMLRAMSLLSGKKLAPLLLDVGRN